EDRRPGVLIAVHARVRVHGSSTSTAGEMQNGLESTHPYVIVYSRSMDVIAGLLNGPRADGAFLLRSLLTPPWSLRVQDQAPLTLVAVISGTAWVIPEPEPAASTASLVVTAPTRLQTGDLAILRGPD